MLPRLQRLEQALSFLAPSSPAVSNSGRDATFLDRLSAVEQRLASHLSSDASAAATIKRTVGLCECTCCKQRLKRHGRTKYTSEAIPLEFPPRVIPSFQWGHYTRRRTLVYVPWCSVNYELAPAPRAPLFPQPPRPSLSGFSLRASRSPVHRRQQEPPPHCRRRIRLHRWTSTWPSRS